jgi:glutathione S-transferase
MKVLELLHNSGIILLPSVMWLLRLCSWIRKIIIRHKYGKIIYNFTRGNKLNVPFSVQRPILFEGAEPDPANYSKLELGFETFDKYLEDQAWAAGDHLTIADFALVASVSTVEVSIIDILML